MWNFNSLFHYIGNKLRQPKEVVIDRPFLFAIRNTKYNITLVVGKVVNPGIKATLLKEAGDQPLKPDQRFIYIGIEFAVLFQVDGWSSANCYFYIWRLHWRISYGESLQTYFTWLALTPAAINPDTLDKVARYATTTFSNPWFSENLFSLGQKEKI